jgi:cell division septum initiation protein DivIVA
MFPYALFVVIVTSMADLSVWDASEESKIPAFPSAFMGYQRKAVDRYLRGLLDARTSRSSTLDLHPGSMVSTDHLNRYHDLGREIGDLLSAVQQTAVRIREQAEKDAAQWRGEATIEVQKRIAEAQASAENLRADAWEVSDQMIGQIQEMEADAYRKVRKHSQEVLAEAENESHRIREDARRRAEAIRSNAHVESLEVEERTRMLCDQMIESAEQQVSAIQERVLALERHRDQLLDEIGGIRSGVAPIGVKLVDQTGGLIYPPTSDEEDQTHVTPQHEMSGLVKVISASAPPEDGSFSDPADGPAKEPEAPISEEEGSSEEERGDSRHRQDFNDLFSSLRSTSSSGSAAERRTEPRRSAPVEVEEKQAIEIREAMVLPITNQFVRLFKRLLTEEQNRVLEGIRTGQLDWNAEGVDGRLRSHLEMLVEQSWQAGHKAAEQVAGHSIPMPNLEVGGETGFVPLLVTEVRGVVESEDLEENAAQRSLLASRMFRVWRSEKLQRHLQEMVEGYYQRAMTESLETVGVTRSDR